MRHSLHLAAIALAISAANPQLLDRMVAVVNKHVILESELDQAVRVEYLMQGKPLDKVSSADSVAVLDRLVDRARTGFHPTPAPVKRPQAGNPRQAESPSPAKLTEINFRASHLSYRWLYPTVPRGETKPIGLRCSPFLRKPPIRGTSRLR